MSGRGWGADAAAEAAGVAGVVVHGPGKGIEEGGMTPFGSGYSLASLARTRSSGANDCRRTGQEDKEESKGITFVV